MVLTHEMAVKQGKQEVQPNFDYMDKNSLMSYGVYMMGKPKIETPQLRTEALYIKGRHGTITRTDGSYDNINITVGIRFPSRGMAKDMQKKKDIAKWLRYGYGYVFTEVKPQGMNYEFPVYQPEGHLRFWHTPDWSFKVKTISPYAWEWHVGTQQWFTTLTFECDPFGYGGLIRKGVGNAGETGEKLATMTTPDGLFYNRGQAASFTLRENSYDIPAENIKGCSPYYMMSNPLFLPNHDRERLSIKNTASYVSRSCIKAPAKTDIKRNFIREFPRNVIANGGAWDGYLGWGLLNRVSNKVETLTTFSGFSYYRSNTHFIMSNGTKDVKELAYRFWTAIDSSAEALEPQLPSYDMRGQKMFITFGGVNFKAYRRWRTTAGTTIESSYMYGEQEFTVPSDAVNLDIVFRVEPETTAEIWEVGLFRNSKPPSFSLPSDTAATIEVTYNVFDAAEYLSPNFFDSATTASEKIARLKLYNTVITNNYLLGFHCSNEADGQKFKTNGFWTGVRHKRWMVSSSSDRTAYDVSTNWRDDQYKYFQDTFYDSTTTVATDTLDKYINDDGTIHFIYWMDGFTDVSELRLAYTDFTITSLVKNTRSVSFSNMGEGAPVYPSIVITAYETDKELKISHTHHNSTIKSVDNPSNYHTEYFTVNLQQAGIIDMIAIECETMTVNARDKITKLWFPYTGWTYGTFPYISPYKSQFYFTGVLSAEIHYREKSIIC